MANAPAPATTFCAAFEASAGGALVGEAVGGMTVPEAIVVVPFVTTVELMVEVMLWWPEGMPEGMPVGRAYPDEAVTPAPGALRLKLAHEMRVLLDRWKTTDRSPK